MLRNKKIKTGRKQGLTYLVMCFAMAMLLWSTGDVVSYAATAKVAASSGNIREKASKDSTKLASVAKNDSLDVISQTKDSDGYTWYKVYINAEKTGYIRADVVTVSGEVPAESTEGAADAGNASSGSSESSGGNVTVVGSNGATTTTAGSTESEADTTTAAASAVGATEYNSGRTTADVRVRSGAGTSFEAVTTAIRDTAVTVTGVSAGSDGKNWYQINYMDGEKDIRGFIREDFLTLETIEEVPYEEIPAEEVPEESIPVDTNDDYVLDYRKNEAGEMEWVLLDNIQGTSQSLEQILEIAAKAEAGELEDGSKASTMRILIIVMAVFLVGLVVAVTVLALKLHDAYEYEYEDEEDEYEEEYEEEEPEEEAKPAKKGFFRKGEAEPEYEEEAPEEIKTSKSNGQTGRPSSTAKTTEEKSWQSKDFLAPDDDMEFEFLDL